MLTTIEEYSLLEVEFPLGLPARVRSDEIKAHGGAPVMLTMDGRKGEPYEECDGYGLGHWWISKDLKERFNVLLGYDPTRPDRD